MPRSRKWFFTLVAVLLFVICGEFLPEEPLRSKAMAVAFGIDLAEDEKLLINLQILTGSGNKTETGSNTRVLSAEGATLGEAAYKISRDTGLAVALTHCNVVLLGESLLKSPYVYSVLNYLVSNAYLSDNACLLACRGSAYDILSSKIGFGGNAGIYIREIVGMYDRFGDVTGKTVRQFVVDYHRIGQTNWLPFLTKISIDPEIASSSSSRSSDKKDYLFEMNEVAVVIKNKFVGIWKEDGAFGVNCILNKISKAQFQSNGDNGEDIDWFILKNDCKLSYDLSEKTVKAKIELQATVKEIIDRSAEDKHVDRLDATEKEIARLEEKISTVVTDFYKETQALDADVFGFREGFYSHYKKKALGLSLSDIKLIADVKVRRT